MAPPARKDVAISESPRAKRDESARAGSVFSTRMPNIPVLMRAKRIPAKRRKSIASATGTDKWTVSRKLPVEVFWITDVPVSVETVTEVTDWVEVGTGFTGILAGSAAGVVVAWTGAREFTGAVGAEVNVPDEVWEPVREV